MPTRPRPPRCPHRRPLTALAAAIALLVLVPAARAATITPTTTGDPAGPGSCPANPCSLRQAIVAAGAGGTVSLLAPAPSGLYSLGLGPLAISADVTITGPGAGTTTIQTTTANRIMTVASGVTLNLSGVTLTGGSAPASGSTGGSGGAIQSNGIVNINAVSFNTNTANGGAANPPFGGSGGEGGAIQNDGVLTIIASAFNGNKATGGAADDFGGSGGEGGAIQNDGVLTISGTTFTNNLATGGAQGTSFGGDGGEGAAIANDSSALVTSTTVSSNNANAGAGSFGASGGEGGAFYSFGSLSLVQSTVNGNTAQGNSDVDGEGGGVYNGGSLRLVQTTLTGNNALGTGSEGGGILNSSSTELQASTLSFNAAESGGGVYSRDSLELTNSTLGGNAATVKGGGIFNQFGSVRSASGTIAGNSAGPAGGGNYYSDTGSLLPHDTIIAGGTVSSGTGGENCAGSGGNVLSAGFNLESSDQCQLTGSGDRVNANPALGALGGNGGPTSTFALLGGSQAIDAGDPAGCTDTAGVPLATDQRGAARSQGPTCDIGAFEATPPPPPPAAQAPSITGLRLNPASFAAQSRGATISAKRRKRAQGTKVSYNDSQKATTGFSVLALKHGIKVGNRCRTGKVKNKPRHPKRCTSAIPRGSFTHADSAGRNSFHFSGRVRRHKLAPGSYLLRAVPTAGTLKGAVVTATFKVVR